MHQASHQNTTETGPNRAPTDANIRITRLSTGGHQPRWALAVFAHNEAETIRAALRSIAPAAAGHDIAVFVLANGCTDATVEEARSCATMLPDLRLAEIRLGDKANAWNVFVHDLLTGDEADDIDTWFFMDGDVALEPDALPRLQSVLDVTPDAYAAGGMPASGRDMAAWRKRMVANGMLSGNLYALRGSFVHQLRRSGIRMPVGLIGEDFFVSWMVANLTWGDDTGPRHKRRCIFNSRAEFTFRSMSPWRLSDYRTYLRRKWRYLVRTLQHEMLTVLLMEEGLNAIPPTVEELYRRAPLPSRLKWTGALETPFRLLAVLRIRSIRKAAEHGR